MRHDKGRIKLIHKTNMDKKVYAIILLGIVALLAFFVVRGTGKLGQATSGSILRIATSSQITVGTSSVITLFNENNGCLNLLITKNSQTIKLTFDGLAGVNSTSTFLAERLRRGQFLNSSTTGVYDAGLYGCGTVLAVAINASDDFPGSNSSSTLFISEGQ